VQQFPRRQPPHRFALRDKPPGPSRHAGHRPTGESHSPGEPVRQSGIYEVVHARAHRASHEVVMLAGDAFPLCDTCTDQVRFRLIRTAPYIFQDEDFEEQ
jgi:hypothetical protein